MQYWKKWKIGWLVVVAWLCWQPVSSQERFWVVFTDKDSVGYDPLTYLSPEAVERRVMNGFPVDHPSDYPVREAYLQAVSQEVEEMGYASRWMNAVAVSATVDQRLQVEQFPFVRSVVPIRSDFILTNDSLHPILLGDDLMELVHRQVDRMQGQALHRAGWDGTGIRVAVFDAGFPDVDNHVVFRDLFTDNRVVATYNFPRKSEFVFRDHWHGTAVLSNICGTCDNNLLGVGTDASFLLARTEMAREPKREEEYWLAAVEWAERQGARLVNSSLGYTRKRYFQEQMDGKHSLVARAANLAARKGMLVINAAGNDGSSKWHTLGTPADADSVLTVGGIDPRSDIHVSFGSFGPTADGRLKPNVSHFGTAVAAKPGNRLKTVNGTSFATPLTTGFAASILEMHPDWSTMQLLRELEKSSHLYPYFDYAHGYGIPQGSYFLETYVEPEPSFEFAAVREEVVIRPKPLEGMKNLTNNYLGHQRMYVHVENKQGTLNKYWVLDVASSSPVVIPRMEWGEDPINMRVYYLGYTETIVLP